MDSMKLLFTTFLMLNVIYCHATPSAAVLSSIKSLPIFNLFHKEPQVEVVPVPSPYPIYKVHKYNGVHLKPVSAIPYLHVPVSTVPVQPVKQFQLPSLDQIKLLLGTTSNAETFDAIKQLASTREGLSLIADFIKATLPNSNIDVMSMSQEQIGSLISSYQYSTPVEVVKPHIKYEVPTTTTETPVEEYVEPQVTVDESHKSSESEGSSNKMELELTLPHVESSGAFKDETIIEIATEPSKEYGNLPSVDKHSDFVSSSIDSFESEPATSSQLLSNEQSSSISNNYGLPLQETPPSFVVETHQPEVEHNGHLVNQQEINHGEVSSPHSQYQPPVMPAFQTYGPPIQAYGPPLQTYGPPIHVNRPPPQTYGPPIQAYGPPLQTYGAPLQAFFQPSASITVGDSSSLERTQGEIIHFPVLSTLPKLPDAGKISDLRFHQSVSQSDVKNPGIVLEVPVEAKTPVFSFSTVPRTALQEESSIVSQAESLGVGRNVISTKFEQPGFSYTQLSSLPLENGASFKSSPDQVSSFGDKISSHIFSEEQAQSASEQQSVVVVKQEKKDVKINENKEVADTNAKKQQRQKWVPKFKRNRIQGNIASDGQSSK